MVRGLALPCARQHHGSRCAKQFARQWQNARACRRYDDLRSYADRLPRWRQRASIIPSEDKNSMNAAIKSTQPDGMSGHPILDRSTRLRAAADRLGFECLDHEWRGRRAEYLFRCGQGHEFLKRMDAMAQPGAGDCAECTLQQRIDRLHAQARDAGSTCLESRWLGSMAMYRFSCAHGHFWKRRGSRALGQAGCPQCCQARTKQRRQPRADDLRLKEAAARQGGQCLADDYQGIEHVYPFQCAEGHVWTTRGVNVLAGKWCRRCAGQRRGEKRRHADGLARLQAIAASHGGECLSNTYEGGAALYRFRCRSAHEWETRGRKVFEGSWCMACVYDAKRYSLVDAQQVAAERGGQCLSAKYLSAAAKLYWACHRGHAWHSPLSTIRAGHWCPECAHMDKITNGKSTARKRYLPSSVGGG